MKSSDLHNLWSAPDNSRITSKQYSFRLPVHVAAKLSALAEMYPQKTRTEIVGDLLATAIDELVKGMPYIEGPVIAVDPDTHEEICADLGPASKFWSLADRHYQTLERELGNDNPPSLYEALHSPRRKDEGDAD